MQGRYGRWSTVLMVLVASLALLAGLGGCPPKDPKGADKDKPKLPKQPDEPKPKDGGLPDYSPDTIEDDGPHPWPALPEAGLARVGKDLPKNQCEGIHPLSNLKARAIWCVHARGCKHRCKAALLSKATDGCSTHCPNHTCKSPYSCEIKLGGVSVEAHYNLVKHKRHLDCSCWTTKVNCNCTCMHSGEF
jgi:hypothetical protein